MPIILVALIGCPTPEGSVDLQALQTQVADQAAQLDSLASTVDGQAAEIAELQATLDAQDLSIYATDSELSAAVAGLASTSDLADFLTQSDVDALGLATRTQLEDALLDRVVTDTVMVTIPGDYPDLNAVLDAYADRVFLPGAFLQIDIDDSASPYVYSEPVIVNHAYGAHILISGNSADPSAVVLEFDETDGIEVRWGSALAYLDGVTIRGVNGAPNTTTGVNVHHNSSAGLGNVVVDGFTRSAVTASVQSFVSVDGLVATGPADTANILVEWNSTVWANGAQVSGSTGDGISIVQGSRGTFAGSTVSAGNRGVQVSDGSSLAGFDMMVTSQSANAFELTAHSVARLGGAQATSASANGASVLDGSYVDLAGADLSMNGSGGLECFGGSYCDLFDATVEGNAAAGILVQVGSTTSIGGLTYGGGNTGGNSASSGVSASETFDPYVP